jgi:hypothetical protein
MERRYYVATDQGRYKLMEYEYNEATLNDVDYPDCYCEQDDCISCTSEDGWVVLGGTE